jgi:hypothetical protein
VPSTPNPPTYQSDGTYLDVVMSIPVSNGGSPIISYQLQIKYKPNEDWVSELGDKSENLQLVFRVRRNVSQGSYIEGRYRAKNKNGWSSFSNSGFLQMVGPPEMPERPVYISSTGSTISL